MLKQRLSKLFTVKSIVTIVLTAIFAVLSLRGVINGEQFLMIFTTVVAFYFGTQSKKGGNNNE